MNWGYFRVASSSPRLRVADTGYNAARMAEVVRRAEARHVGLLVFPELSLTGYTCQDLFLQKTLRLAAVEALASLCRETADTGVLFCAGLPVECGSRLYNAAAFVLRGRVLAIIPKTYIPNYSEFYEERWFSPFDSRDAGEISLGCGLEHIPFGTDIIIESAEDSLVKIAAEICEDLWVPLSPSTRHALAGAAIIANPSAGNEVVGKADYRRLLVAAHSAKTVSAYVYAGAGRDESTSDIVFSGHSMIAVNGSIKAEALPFEGGDDGTAGAFIEADADLEKLEQDRLRSNTFSQAPAGLSAAPYRTVRAEGINRVDYDKGGKLLDSVEPHPFVPADEGRRRERCTAVIEMQSEGLAKRFRHIGAKSAVVGISGGLDSTLALLVCARAADKAGMPREGILAVSMPGFGTTKRTRDNAAALASAVGVTFKEVGINAAVKQHFEDIGQDAATHDVTYENSQARERTQVLMDLANKTGGIVIGTGDLSELALGWCTYNGDHMSMYGVNSSIPKTLVRHLVAWFSDEDARASPVLKDILATPVSPELLPPEDGAISQKTEEIVGPYELHDFFLYYVLRWGFTPEKIAFLARQAFLGRRAEGVDTVYTEEIIDKWLAVFFRRFFSQQFKRNCMPDGAKVGTVNLSPRGDWRMPSDASAEEWLTRAERLRPPAQER